MEINSLYETTPTGEGNELAGEEIERQRIMVIDDEEHMRQLLEKVLSMDGHNVTCVATGEEGILEFRRQDYSLAVVDLKLPGIDGLEVLHQVKQISPTTEVILITGYASLGTAIESLKLGAADYLAKPFRVEHLKIIIERSLKRKKLLEISMEVERYKKLSQIDELTDLYNRRFFQQALATELTRARRYERQLSLLMLDIDNFKKYNDENGHIAGDDLLKKVAWVLRGATRDCDYACRYGGEEFAIIAPETPKIGASRLGLRLRKVIEKEEFKYSECFPQGRVTVSVGLATYPEDASDLKTLIEMADGAMYKAKNEGRNRCAMVIGAGTGKTKPKFKVI
jgi:diguanylate cyclase (GGDEF)-like protein